jgi:hypothetical protein
MSNINKTKNYETMSIKELRLEVNKCKNPMKKKLIKKLIDFKESEKPKGINYNMFQINKEDDDILDELMKHKVEEDYDKKSLYEHNLHEQSLQQESSYDIDSKRTNNMKDMVNKDLANNKMMERLNGELNFRINGFNKKYIDKPYIDDIQKDKRVVKNYSTNDQASYLANEFTHDIPDFTSKKWIEKRI